MVSRPDGTWVDYASVMCMLGDPQEMILAPAPADAAGEGPDRYSEQVPLTFGSSGFVFDQPGTYRIKAVYHDGRVTSVSNVASLRVGTPATREEDRLAADWFSNAVGLTVALGGSMSPHLDPAGKPCATPPTGSPTPKSGCPPRRCWRPGSVTTSTDGKVTRWSATTRPTRMPHWL